MIHRGPRVGDAGTTRPLQLVGYWHAAAGDGWPHPQQLVHPRWEWRRRRRILRYLAQAPCALEYRGWSSCRFGCRLANGTRDLTDGTWVWPEGLAHYVRVHGVSLPDAFVAHMASRDFQVPASAPPTFHSHDVVDDVWREWAARQGPFRPIACCYACDEARLASGLPSPSMTWIPARSLFDRLWYVVGWNVRATASATSSGRSLER